MQELEKLLEEIDETIERYGKNPYIDEKATELCYGMTIVKDIIRKHMDNDGWISVEERMPEEPLESVIGWDAYRERCCFVQCRNGRFELSSGEPDRVRIPDRSKPGNGCETGR